MPYYGYAKSLKGKANDRFIFRRNNFSVIADTIPIPGIDSDSFIYTQRDVKGSAVGSATTTKVTCDMSARD